MRNVVVGLVGVLWGAAVIVYGVLHGIASGAYGAGQVAGIGFGCLLLVAGARALLRARN